MTFQRAVEMCDLGKGRRILDAIFVIGQYEPNSIGLKSRVYFIQAENGGPIKIGYASHRTGVEDRRQSLQTGNPYLLKLLAAVPGTAKDERALHLLFAAERLQGEWFKPHRDLTGLISVVQRYEQLTSDLERFYKELADEDEGWHEAV